MASPKENMFSVELEKLTPGTGAPFPLYLFLRTNGRMIPLSLQGSPLGEDLYEKLLRQQHRELWVPQEFAALLPAFLELTRFRELLNDHGEEEKEPQQELAALAEKTKAIADRALTEASVAQPRLLELMAIRSISSPHEHSVFVGNLAAAAALSAGHSDPAWIADLILAATFHDIGLPLTKVAGSWHRRSQWSEEERKEYESHVEKGLTLLRDSEVPFSENVLRMIREHHEKADGSGYPQGLFDSEMCEGSRILSWANLFHQLCTGELSAEPLTPAQASAMIRNNGLELGFSDRFLTMLAAEGSQRG